MFPSKRECSPVDSNWFFTFYFFVDNHCILRIKVLGFQQLPWFICTDGNDGQIKTSKNLSELLEYTAITCVTWIKYFLSFWCLDHKTTPESFTLIKQPSSWPMTSRHKCNLKLFPIDDERLRMCPIHFVKFAILWEAIFWLKSSDKDWVKQLMEFIDRIVIKMIIMIMADQYQIDVRQLTNLARDVSEAFWTHKLQGRASRREYRVDH